ncbi:MAG: protein phosphatase 2C domain-containing protein [Ramlibacter sp.]
MNFEVLSLANANWIIVTTRQAAPTARRTSCQDAIGAELLADGGCAIAVADGVGSGARGDVCSAAAVAHSLRAAPYASDVRDVLAGADSAVRAALTSHTSARGATTLVGAWLDAWGEGWVGHCGDSRAYVARMERLCVRLDPITRDHSYRNLGLATPLSGSPDDPARMLGLGRCGTCEVRQLLVSPGDLVMLCTDGLHARLELRGLERGVGKAVLEMRGLDTGGARERLALLARALVNDARAHRSCDDASIALAWRRQLSEDWQPGGLSCRISS